ncbi:MAG: hypothetical protein V1846_03120 [Candidatus Komeilibacteria bacterium]
MPFLRFPVPRGTVGSVAAVGGSGGGVMGGGRAMPTPWSPGATTSYSASIGPGICRGPRGGTVAGTWLPLGTMSFIINTPRA